MISLVPLELSLIDRYLGALSPRVADLLHISCLEQEKQYIMPYCEKNLMWPFFVILESAEGNAIGGIQIRSPEISVGQLYCWINEQYWGKGHFRAALIQACRTFFTHNSEESLITAHVEVTNERSYYALKKVSFCDKGIRLGSYGPEYELVLLKKFFMDTVG
jgi:RimJ/RimL family protein N-acetyltransferase